MDQLSCYRKLVKWVFQSLDAYKGELLEVAYPLFVHCFIDAMNKGNTAVAREFFTTHRSNHMMRHSTDIETLAAVTERGQLDSVDLVRTMLNSKYVVALSQPAYKLVVAHLQLPVQEPLAKFTNEHLTFKLVTPMSSTVWVDRSTTTEGSERFIADVMASAPERAGTVTSLASNMPQPIQWGVPVTDGQRRALEDGSNPWPVSGSAGMIPPPRTRLFFPILQELACYKAAPVATREEADMRVRASLLGPKSASVTAACFTLMDCANTAACAVTSKDATTVAAGFDDAVVRVWRLDQHPVGTPYGGPYGVAPAVGGGAGAAAAPPPPLPPSAALFGELSGGGGGGGGDGDGDLDLGGEGEEAGALAVPAPPPSHVVALAGHSARVTAVAISPDMKWLLSGALDGSIRLWDLALQKTVAVYKGHDFPVWSLAFAPMTSSLFASGGRDGVAYLWNTATVVPVRMLVGHAGDVDCVVFHPNSHFVVTGSSDSTLRLWHLELAGSCTHVMSGHTAGVTAVTVSPDGRFVASAALDWTVRVWDLDTFAVKVLLGHEHPVYSLAFSGESGALVSGSIAGVLRVWDMVKVVAMEAPPVGLPPAVRVLGRAEDAPVANGAGSPAHTPLPPPGKRRREREEEADGAGAGDGAGDDTGEVSGRIVTTSCLSSTFRTKSTRVLDLRFSTTNLLTVCGVFDEPVARVGM